jgi:hypothetical protein
LREVCDEANHLWVATSEDLFAMTEEIDLVYMGMTKKI